MISINSVYKYVDLEDGERIRIIEIQEEYVYFVNIDSNTSMPYREYLIAIEEEIECEKLIKISDPFIVIVKDDELTEIQKNMRDNEWGFIEKYWGKYKEDILEKTNRTKALKNISIESGININKVKRIFSRFWQRGMNRNALLPDYLKCGGKGKEKKLNNIKTGKPRKTDYYGNLVKGINITDEVKKQFNYVIDKYYRRKNKGCIKITFFQHNYLGGIIYAK